MVEFGNRPCFCSNGEVIKRGNGMQGFCKDALTKGVAALAGCLIFALCGASPTLAAEPPPYHSSFGPDGTEATGFERAGPIAVDQQDHFVYVLDHTAGSLFKFDTEGHAVSFGGAAPYISGNAITGLSPFFCNGCSQVAVDPVSHDIYVTTEGSLLAFHSDGEPSEFTAGPGAGNNAIPYGPGTELLGVAVDANGNIYASDYNSGVDIYGHSGELITEFSVTSAGNIAVDGNGNVYVNRWADTVLRFSPSESSVTSATIYTADPEPLDPRVSWTVAVDPATNDVYVAELSESQPQIAWYNEDGVLLATFAGVGEEGEVESSEGVAIFSQEEAVFVSNLPSSGLSQVEIFWDPVLPGPPRVEGVAALDITADSATLRARINPSRAETTYYFEYCSASACASVPAGGASVGDGHKFVVVSQNLTGLQANTTYHYRVFAENEHGDNLAAEGDHVFTTQPSGVGFELSDSRAWELVTPIDKQGAVPDGAQVAHVQAAANGEGITYPTLGPVEEFPDGSRAFEASSVLSRRMADGWRSKDLTPPNERVVAIPLGAGGEYKLFSSDLSSALLDPRTDTPHSSEASEKTPYLRENTEPGVYTPLVHAGNVPAGTKFGSRVDFAGGSADLSHIVLSSEAPLVAGAPPAPARSLYLWVGGDLHPLSVLPAAEGGEMVATDLLGSGHMSLRHAVSDDGSRVFWSTGEAGKTTANDITGLYLRDSVNEVTIRIDAQSGVNGANEPRPTFQGASADGTVVFFSDPQQLTENASPSGSDLYRCEIPAGSPITGCSSLVDITAPMAGSGESSEVLGVASGVADDGSAIYFVVRGVLDDEANGAGATAASGAPNLYLWQEGQGVRFIATLAEEDQNAWGGEQEAASELSAATSPGGRYLSFMSQRSLTGEDNLDAASGEPVERVFRYDAAADRLDCISCDPTGAAPSGELVGELAQVDPRFQWRGREVAAMLPEPPISDIGLSRVFYSPRAVLDNGRVFFNAVDSLVAADGNSQWDIYQYEPEGAGDCTNSSGAAASSRIASGCVSLISSGTGEVDAAFLDASKSGDDVFFLTAAQLNVPDQDATFDVYDARVNGVPALLPSRTECVGEACQPLVTSPSPVAPGSASLKGPGNVKHCPKGKRKVRRKGKAVCVRRHHKHKRHHKRAGQDRRASR
jgi:hypothetical protein